MLPLLLSLLLFSIATLPRCSSECTPNHKFWACCQQIGISSFWVNEDYLISKACQYPPEELSIPQSITLGYYVTEYNWCYADAQNNRDCCGRAFVSPETAWYTRTLTFFPGKQLSIKFFWANCRDLCDGTLAHMDAKLGYNGCAYYRDEIAQCNSEANNMETDTAIRQNKQCKGKLCDRPMQWKEGCSGERNGETDE